METAGAATMELTVEPASRRAAEGRQFVTFTVEGQSYGIPIASVREIICWTDVTPLPNQPAFTRGVLNLRGTVVPVHDLRTRLSGARTQATGTHVIVIVYLGTQTLGILVDAVSDILTVMPEDLKTPPQGSESAASAALVSTDGNQLLTILNLSALFGQGQSGQI